MGTPAIAEHLIPLLDKTPIVSAGGSVSDDYLQLVEGMLGAVTERRDLFWGLAQEKNRLRLALEGV